jgi:hypothetical protein
MTPDRRYWRLTSDPRGVVDTGARAWSGDDGRPAAVGTCDDTQLSDRGELKTVVINLG